MTYGKSNIVIFDDQCKKCNRGAEFIRRRNQGSSITLIGQNSRDGKEIMKAIPRKFAGHDSVFLISSRGEWHSKSAAIWRVCVKLRFPWPLASLMVLLPWPLRDYFYDVYARMRK